MQPFIAPVPANTASKARPFLAIDAPSCSRLFRRYKSGIERVTAPDVLAAAQRRLHPSQQTIVVAGDAARLRPELEKLGLPIEDLPLS